MLLHDFKFKLSYQVFLYHQRQTVFDSFNIVRVKLSGIVYRIDMKDGADDTVTS